MKVKDHLEDESVEDMEERLGFVGDIRKDLQGKSYEIKRMILAEEGITLHNNDEAVKDGKAVSLLAKDQVAPSPKPKKAPEAKEPTNFDYYEKQIDDLLTRPLA